MLGVMEPFSKVSSKDHVEALCRIVQSEPRLMHSLRVVRSLNLPEWCIAAGAIRNPIWDRLHAFSHRNEPTDVDVLYFDPGFSDQSEDEEVEARLRAVEPAVRWEAVNQATIHTYIGDPAPYRSIGQAMSRWVDPMTAVGVCLDERDELAVIAPFGLDDLFNMVVRPHLAAPGAERIYRDRLARKRWADRWPKVRIVELP